MSEYIVTVPKKHLKPDLVEYNPPPPHPIPGLNQFWDPTCGRMHTHMNDTAFLLCPD